MTVGHAREAARQWLLEEAPRIPGFRAAYTAGSTNWLADDASLDPASDLDIMVVTADPQPSGRGKFLYRGTLLEASYLPFDLFQSPEAILADYHLAPSFRTTPILFDPAGSLGPVHHAVCRDYAKRRWVRRRCDHARDKVLAALRPAPDPVMACLFAAGITTHILLTAGLKNPTVRARYVAVRTLLESCGRLSFHEDLLNLLGAAHIGPGRAARHAAALAPIFDAAAAALRTPVPFACDITTHARPIAIEGSLEFVRHDLHREAMFWVAVTQARCRQILDRDAPHALTGAMRAAYDEITADLGLATPAEIQTRRAEIERVLPRARDEAELILAANPAIEND